MEERELWIKTLARLEAIEYVQAYLLSSAYYDAKLSIEKIEASQQQIIQQFLNRNVTGLPAVQADHYSAEVKECVERTLKTSLAAVKALRAGE